MNKLACILPILFLLASCATKKSVSKTSYERELLRVTYKDTTLYTSGKKTDTVLLLKEVLPQNGKAKETVIKSNKVVTRILISDSTLHLKVELDSLKTELRGFIKTEIIRDKTTKEEAHKRIPNYAGYALMALIVLMAVALITKIVK